MRYALGVGIGTPIVALLWETYRDTISPKISLPSPFSGTAAALLWAAAGTAYCYVASVPMLTLHSTRRILTRTPCWVTISFSLLIAALIGAWVLDYFQFMNLLLFRLTGAIVLVAIVGFQFALLGKVLYAPDKTHEFYLLLSKRRKDRSDFVESYRHMREHGNAVSIVIFELLLAFILWCLKPAGSTAGNLAPVGRVGLILASWLAPSALVWLIGSSLERSLSRLPARKSE